MPALSVVGVAIVAGGQSSRFGSNKALTLIDGRAIIERVIGAASDLSDDLYLVTNTPELYQYLGLRMVADLKPEGGALRGLHTALSSTEKTWVLCLACDMPFVKAPLLKNLVALTQTFESRDWGAVVPRHPGGAEPLCAVYRREVCLPELERLLAGGRYRLQGLLDLLSVRYVEPPELTDIDSYLVSFVNVNTPDEWMAAEALAKQMKR